MDEDEVVYVLPPDERSDTDVELAVNLGLAAATLEGLPEGLKIMEDAGVPMEISLRVLKNKAGRRASDWR